MRTTIGLAICLALSCSLYGADAPDGSRDIVLGLKPVGFWPLLGGDGEKVVDLSPNANHGNAINLPRDSNTGLLEFRNAFQYIEIPANKAYQTPSLSCGGWVFLREMPMGGNWRPRVGFQVIGHQHWLQEVGAHVSIRHHGVPAATTGDKKNPYDVLGNWDHSAKTPPKPGLGVLSVGSWQHVLFTFDAKGGNAGRGVLYLNGRQIAARDDVTYKKGERPLVAGNNAFWWHQTVSGATGLSGSLRDIVWFARALTSKEVASLAGKTKPVVIPARRQQDTVVVRTKWYDVESLPALPKGVRREVLDELLTWKESELASISDVLVGHLSPELAEPDMRLSAAKLLNRLGSDAARKALIAGIPASVRALADEKLTKMQRAEAALTLGEMGPSAVKQAKMPLLQTLRAETNRRSGAPSRVEDVLQNACILALKQVAVDDSDVVALVSQVTKSLRDLLKDGEPFFTYRGKGRGNELAYTPTLELKDVKYRVGEGHAWRGVEKVTHAEYATIVGRLPEKYQGEAKKWAEGKYEHLYRVPLYRTMPDGKTQKVYLEGDEFVLYGADAKMRGWSLFADEQGYIHLMGGQHNAPNPDLFIPGSWEKMGLPRSRAEGPRQMYWVSRKPESIDGFEFVGARKDPRAIPIDYLNYMVFVKSFGGQNLLFGRIDHYGWQSWGAFIYDAAEKNWRAIGGDAYHVYEAALREDPKWSYYAPRSTRAKGRIVQPMIRGGIPGKPVGKVAMAWSWNPAFYNFCRDDWGVRFDRTGRMHVRVNIFGIEERGFYDHRKLYAFSDDVGRTFRRADGSPVKLPLTSNPAPAHNADLTRNRNGQWLELWLDVLRLTGVEPAK